MRRVLLTALVALAACHNDTTPESNDEHSAGDDAPFEVDCDAPIVQLARYEHDVEMHVHSSERAMVVATYGPDAPSELRLLTECGEPARLVARGVSVWGAAPLVGLPWYVAEYDGESFVAEWLLDPFDGRAQQLPRSSIQVQPAGWSRHGLGVWRHHNGTEELVEVTFGPDGVVKETLLAKGAQGISLWRDDINRWASVATTDDTVVLLDLDARSSEVVATSSVGSLLDVDGRFFFLSSTPARASNNFVLDRVTGSRIRLGRPSWEASEQRAWTSVVAAAGPLDVGSAPAETHVVLLPEMQELWWAAAGMFVDTAVGGDGSRLFLTEHVLLRVAAGDREPHALALEPEAFARGVQLYAADEPWVIVRESSVTEAPARFGLYRVPRGESQLVRVIAEPVTAFHGLGEARWSFVRPDSTLWVFDERTGRSNFVADRVMLDLVELNEWVGAPTRAVTQLVFRTADDDGGSTLWRADLDRLE